MPEGIIAEIKIISVNFQLIVNRRNDFATLIGGGCFAEFRGHCKNAFTVRPTTTVD